MARLSEDTLLRLACVYAEQDRTAFTQAYAHMPGDPAARRARAFLKQLRAYRLKRWGPTLVEKLCVEARAETPPVIVQQTLRRQRRATP